jgi:hypothetical protein
MADVFTTIKEHAWIVGLILSTSAAFFGSGWAGKGVVWTFALSHRGWVAGLKKQRARLQQLHDSDRAYYGWLLSSVLWVLALLGVQLVIEGYMALGLTRLPEEQHKYHALINITRLGMGFAVYSIALNRLIQNWLRRRHFDRDIARLDRAIARLEVKQESHQPATATMHEQSP